MPAEYIREVAYSTLLSILNGASFIQHFVFHIY